MNLSSAASGSGYVPSHSIGFSVASTMKRECSLSFWRGTVDFAGEHEICEYRTVHELEFTLSRTPNLCPDYITRKKNWSELDPTKFESQNSGNQFREKSLPDSRVIFKQNMAASYRGC